MTILKWISIILFLLLVASIVIVAIIELLGYICTIIIIFKKYPEIEKHWFKGDSYNDNIWTYPYGRSRFRLYTTKNGAVVKVSKEDGEILYHLKNAVEVLLFGLIATILFFGACNTILLFFA